MTLNDNKSYGSSGSEEDPWELIDDETTPIAAPQNNGVTATVPDNYIGEVAELAAEGESHPLDAAAQSGMGGGGGIGDESFITAVSSIADHLAANDGDVNSGEDDANDEEGIDGMAPKEEQEDLLAAYWDEKIGRWVFPLDLAAGPAEPPAPPLPEKAGATESRASGANATVDEAEKQEGTDDSAFQPASESIVLGDSPPSVASEEYACTTKPSAPLLLTDDEKTEQSPSTVGSEKDLGEKDLGEKAAPDDEKYLLSDLVDSLSNMGFEKTLIEKTIESLRLAGAEKIDHDSVIGSMAAADTEEESESSNLLESLTSMGFKKERIEQAIQALHEGGRKEIDEDAVLEEMERPTNDDRRNRRPWDPLVEFAATEDLRAQNRLLRRRSRRVARDLGASAKDLWTNVRGESARLRANFKAQCDEADLPERTARAAAEVRHAAASAGNAIARANEEYRIAEKVATAAVVGGAALLALGNPRAGVGVIAAAGATLAVGEAMKQSSVRSGSTYTRDYGLDEGLHID